MTAGTAAPDDDLRSPLARYAGERPPAPGWFTQAIELCPQRSLVEVRGARIELLAWGDRGRPGLLFLHGGRAHADWWSFIAPFFADRYRVAAISWSGMGRSDWREAYSIDTFAAEALEGARAAGLFDADTPPIVVAHSFGGWCAMHAAATFGERLKATVILDSGVRLPAQSGRDPPRPPRPNRVYATMQDALAHFRLLPVQPCDNAFLLDFIAREALKPSPMPRTAGDAVDAAREGATGWTWRFDPFLQSKLNPDFGPKREAGLASARCPVALMWGADSALLNAETLAYTLAKAPAGSPRIVIPRAAHHLFLDQPLAVVAALRGLLSAWPNR